MVDGRVVVVTGGARGVGLAIGTAFAARGARVVLADIDEPAVSAAAAALPTDGHLGVRVDVRDERSCQDLIDATVARFGGIDILVNCAGVAVIGEFADLSAAQQELQLEVNLHGVVRLTRLVLPAMLARGSGRIINIASASGRIPAPRAAVYSATKHAVVALTEALRWEVRGRGVRLTAVLPTVVTTEMAAGLRTPGLPVVDAADVARVVLRVARRADPPAVVLVPRWFAIAVLGDRLSPRWLRDLVRRVVRVDRRAGDRDQQAYLERISRQLTE